MIASEPDRYRKIGRRAVAALEIAQLTLRQRNSRRVLRFGIGMGQRKLPLSILAEPGLRRDITRPKRDAVIILVFVIPVNHQRRVTAEAHAVVGDGQTA